MTSFINANPSYNSSFGSKITESLKLLGKRQDYVYSAKVYLGTGELHYDIIMLFDGHGNDSCIKTIREMNKIDIILAENPCQALFDILNSNSGIDLHSGSTMCYAKIFKNHIETDFMGDSSILIFCNEELKYSNMEQHHNISHEDEAERLCGKGIVKKSMSYRVVGENIASIKSNYFKFNAPSENIVQLVPTQSLGHWGITGIKSSRQIFRFSFNDEIKVIIVSDGVTDMIKTDEIKELWQLTAEEIAERAEARWKQDWKIDYEGDIITTSFPPDGYDDCGVIIYEKNTNKPLPDIQQIV